MLKSIPLLLWFCFIHNLAIGQQASIQWQPLYAHNSGKEFKIEVRIAKMQTNGFCKEPLRYLIRKTGTATSNYTISWGLPVYSCEDSKEKNETITIDIPSGNNSFETERILYVASFGTETSVRVIKECPDFPIKEFSINGEQELKLGCSSLLKVVAKKSGQDVTGVKWMWYENGKPLPGNKSETIVNPKTNTTYKVYAEKCGFKTKDFISFSVKVLSPQPPQNYSIAATELKANKAIGPEYLQSMNANDTQSIKLKIKHSLSPAALEHINWIWVLNNKEQVNGDEIKLSAPLQGQTVSVFSEYRDGCYSKRSEAKRFVLNVTTLPGPPNFTLVNSKKVITEGDEIWLRANTASRIPGTIWHWNGPGILRQVGDSVLIKATVSSKYTAYAELNTKKSSVQSIDVQVRMKTKAPEITGDFKRCENQAISNKILLTGGLLGTGAKEWFWYEKSTSGEPQFIGKGLQKELSPNKTTSYYITTDLDKTILKEFTIDVIPAPGVPTAIMSNPQACSGEVITLEASGNYQKGKEEWLWYREDIDGKNRSFIGEGSKVSDNIKSDSRYFIEAKNSNCTVTSKSPRVVTLFPGNKPANFIHSTKISGSARKVQLSISGGSLASGAEWYWYENYCNNGQFLGKGTSIKYRLKKQSTVFVKAVGGCENSSCVQRDFAWQKLKTKFVFVNFGVVSNELKTPENYCFTIGGRYFYVRAKGNVEYLINQEKYVTEYQSVHLQSSNNLVENYPTGTNTYYEFNGLTSKSHTAITAGTLLGGNVLRFYLGGGYGIREVLWGIDVYQNNSNFPLQSIYAKNQLQSYKGVEAEAGIFLRLKFLNLMGGASIIFDPALNKQYIDAQVGIGFTFSKKH